VTYGLERRRWCGAACRGIDRSLCLMPAELLEGCVSLPSGRSRLPLFRGEDKNELYERDTCRHPFPEEYHFLEPGNVCDFSLAVGISSLPLAGLGVGRCGTWRLVARKRRRAQRKVVDDMRGRQVPAMASISDHTTRTGKHDPRRHLTLSCPTMELQRRKVCGSRDGWMCDEVQVHGDYSSLAVGALWEAV